MRAKLFFAEADLPISASGAREPRPTFIRAAAINLAPKPMFCLFAHFFFTE
jgi:hypothetical protein